MTRQPFPPVHSTEVETDIQLAAHSSLPVLIAAPPDRALAVARAIAAAAGATRDVIVCDSEVPEGAAGAGILFVREVQRLTPKDQARLMGLLETRRATGRQTPRIIASASACLFELVVLGRFDECLFYRLNTIHIAVSWHDGEAGKLHDDLAACQRNP